MANVSLAVPTIHPLIAIDANGAVKDQRDLAAACVTHSADADVQDGAIAMAWRVIDAASDRHSAAAARARVITEPLLEVVRELEFVTAMGQRSPYRRQPGVRVLRVERCMERCCYIALSSGRPWRTTSKVSRGSSVEDWRRAHHFYDPFPSSSTSRRSSPPENAQSPGGGRAGTTASRTPNFTTV
jgi:hypothetical protein